jgi:hypothetical protein
VRRFDPEAHGGYNPGKSKWDEIKFVIKLLIAYIFFMLFVGLFVKLTEFGVLEDIKEYWTQNSTLILSLLLGLSILYIFWLKRPRGRFKRYWRHRRR